MSCSKRKFSQTSLWNTVKHCVQQRCDGLQSSRIFRWSGLSSGLLWSGGEAHWIRNLMRCKAWARDKGSRNMKKHCQKMIWNLRLPVKLIVALQAAFDSIWRKATYSSQLPYQEWNILATDLEGNTPVLKENLKEKIPSQTLGLSSVGCFFFFWSSF